MIPTLEQFEHRIERLMNRAYHAKKNHLHFMQVADEVKRINANGTANVSESFAEKFDVEYKILLDAIMVMTGWSSDEIFVRMVGYRSDRVIHDAETEIKHRNEMNRIANENQLFETLKD